MVTEYDEYLGYDADHDDANQYCIHGTWIGSWWGPDYLCYYCEDGLSAEASFSIKAGNAYYHAKEKIKELMMPYHSGKFIFQLGAESDNCVDLDTCRTFRWRYLATIQELLWE